MRPLLIIDEDDITADLDGSIRKLLCECFPPDIEIFSKTRHWNGCRPDYSILSLEESDVLGHIGIVIRDIICDDMPVRIAGVQNFAISPKMRGKGLSQQLESAAMHEAARRGINYALLFCVPQLEKFYVSLGWVVVASRVFLNDENGHLVSSAAKSIIMSKSLGDGLFPEGDINLKGRDW